MRIHVRMCNDNKFDGVVRTYEDEPAPIRLKGCFMCVSSSPVQMSGEHILRFSPSSSSSQHSMGTYASMYVHVQYYPMDVHAVCTC